MRMVARVWVEHLELSGIAGSFLFVVFGWFVLYGGKLVYSF